MKIARKKLVERHNAAFANGWHAQVMVIKAKNQQKTMADIFREQVEGYAIAYTVPAFIVGADSQKTVYKFLDESEFIGYALRLPDRE